MNRIILTPQGSLWLSSLMCIKH